MTIFDQMSATFKSMVGKITPKSIPIPNELSEEHAIAQQVRGRRLFTPDELYVWKWLVSNLTERHVVPKLAFSRFMRLMETGDQSQSRVQGSSHLRLYSSFALLSPEGQVVGCVDIKDPDVKSQALRERKQALLKEIGVPYAVLDPHQLPPTAEIREIFIGRDKTVQREKAALEAQFGERRKVRAGTYIPNVNDRRMVVKEREIQK